MTKYELIEGIARERMVEKMCQNVAHSPNLTPDLEDLAQICYRLLLEYDEGKLLDLQATGALPFFLARLVMNQYKYDRTTYYNEVRKFRRRAVPLTEIKNEEER